MLPVMILTFIVNVIRWLFWRFGWWAALILLVFVVNVAIVLSSVFSPGPGVPPGNIAIPSVSQAPYLVETASRYYYAEAYEKDGDNTILEGYWTLEDDRWVHKDRLILTPAFGDVTIGKRR